MEQQGGMAKPGLNAGQLKLIAIAAMTIDHIAFAFVPDGTLPAVLMHMIGRLTGPIMFYLAVEGYRHTRSLKRYVGRLAVFAAVSYFPFLLFKAGGDPAGMRLIDLNVIYTIMLGVIAIAVRRKLKNPVAKAALILFLAALSVPADWGIWGFSIIVTFDFYEGNFSNQAFGYTLITLFAVGVINLMLDPIYLQLYYGPEYQLNLEHYLSSIESAGMFLPLLLLRRYNGQRGSGVLAGKWLFYIFYPAHLLLISSLQFLLYTR